MRFMMIVKASKESEEGVMPTEQELAEMGRFNEELVNSGAMLGGEGLHPTSRGIRVTYSGNDRTVTDGPFAEAKEQIAGFWIIKANSREEVIEIARRVPFREGEVEIRQIFEADEFGEAFTPELREQERKIAEQILANANRG